MYNFGMGTVGSGISVMQLHIWGTFFALAHAGAFFSFTSCLCMKRIFSTYTTEHVCMAMRFFGFAGLSFYTFVHSTGVEVAIGAGEGTGSGMGCG